MNHFSYQTDRARVCEYPERLGSDLITVGSYSERMCGDCFALVFTHNQRQFDLDANMVVSKHLAPARGIMYGLVASVFVWLLAAFVYWMLTRG